MLGGLVTSCNVATQASLRKNGHVQSVTERELTASVQAEPWTWMEPVAEHVLLVVCHCFARLPCI